MCAGLNFKVRLKTLVFDGVLKTSCVVCELLDQDAF